MEHQFADDKKEKQFQLHKKRIHSCLEFRFLVINFTLHFKKLSNKNQLTNDNNHTIVNFKKKYVILKSLKKSLLCLKAVLIVNQSTEENFREKKPRKLLQ